MSLPKIISIKKVNAFLATEAKQKEFADWYAAQPRYVHTKWANFVPTRDQEKIYISWSKGTMTLREATRALGYKSNSSSVYTLLAYLGAYMSKNK